MNPVTASENRTGDRQYERAKIRLFRLMCGHYYLINGRSEIRQDKIVFDENNI